MANLASVSNSMYSCQQFKLLFYCNGNILDVSLGGKRALEFDGDEVLRVGQQHHVIAIFVGTLMKLYKKDLQFLSATSACSWYINENDIPEIKEFQKRYAFFQ
jgi:replication factor A1